MLASIINLQEFLQRYEDEIRNTRPDWGRLFIGAPHSGPLSEESLIAMNGGREIYCDDKLLNDIPLAAAFAFIRQIPRKENYTTETMIIEMLSYLFKNAKYTYYKNIRIDIEFYEKNIESEMELPMIYIWNIFKIIYSKSSSKTILNKINTFIDNVKIKNSSLGNCLHYLSKREINSLYWLRRSCKILHDDIFLGFVLIKEFFFDALDDEEITLFNRELDNCVNRFFICNGLGY